MANKAWFFKKEHGDISYLLRGDHGCLFIRSRKYVENMQETSLGSRGRGRGGGFKNP